MSRRYRHGWDDPWYVRPSVIGLGLVAATAAVVVALAVSDDEPEFEYVSICMENGVRVDDNAAQCPDRFNDQGEPVHDEPYHPHGGILMLINTSSGYNIPAVGQPVATGGLLPKPPPPVPGVSPARVQYKAAPPSGGAIVRGGFGAKSGSSAGG